jgi:threonine/homoserine/homoserine lactone efflux protein
MIESMTPVLAGFGIGIALAGAPGPVQAVLLSEAVHGGMHQGLRALAGASLTFGVLLALLAVGVSLKPEDGPVLRLLQLGGGAFLIWLAADGLRSSSRVVDDRAGHEGLPAAARGSIAILLNPGAWLFIGAVASPLLATATRLGGTTASLVAAAALLIGAGVGDLGVVILGAGGLRRARPAVGRWIRKGLAVILGVLGVLLLTGALVG